MALWAGEWSAQLDDGHVRDLGGTGLHCPRMDGQGHSHTSTCRHGLFSSEDAIVEGTRRMFTARRTYQFMEQREPVFRSPPRCDPSHRDSAARAYRPNKTYLDTFMTKRSRFTFRCSAQVHLHLWTPCRRVLSKAAVPKVWSLDPQHKHHLKTFLYHWDLLNRKL